MIDLGVNIDHVATLRQQRHVSYPDPVRAALLAEEAGADLITLHLREDRRHIQDVDVHAIKGQLRTRMNLECAITAEMLAIACQVKPHDVCLVPEKRQELTTEGGLDVLGHFDTVKAAVAQLQDAGIRVSLFIDPEAGQIEAAHRAGATVIELHTGAYAQVAGADAVRELARIREGIAAGLRHGLRVNAGHGLHYENVQAIAELDGVAELNIGHAIVAQAIFSGWTAAVRDMKALMVTARQQAHRGVLLRPGHSVGMAADGTSPPIARKPAVAGIGIDLLRIERVERALARRGDRFAQKILGPQELVEFAARRARDPQRGIRFLATRFAAKEAFSKAIGLGMRMPMAWSRMQTLNAPSGKPVVVLAEPLRSWYEARFGAAHVSITDEYDMAAAYVVVESLS